MSFEISQIEQIATLAHLSLSEDEKSRYATQLEAILGYMQILNTLPLYELDTVIPESTLRRDDVSQVIPLNLEKNAPLWAEGCFEVPKMMD